FSCGCELGPLLAPGALDRRGDWARPPVDRASAGSGVRRGGRSLRVVAVERSGGARVPPISLRHAGIAPPAGDRIGARGRGVRISRRASWSIGAPSRERREYFPDP